MSAPRFFSRIADAAIPVLDGVDVEMLGARLDGTIVRLGLADGVEEDLYSATFDLAANLLARLYPTIILDAPEGTTAAASERILAINPACDVRDSGDATFALWLGGVAEPRSQVIGVHAEGWRVVLDDLSPLNRPPAPLALLVAACVGAGELFRAVFAGELGLRGRATTAPGFVDLLPRSKANAEEHLDGTGVDIGPATLIGAGAIGQALLMALRSSRARGELTIVDPEPVELSNLQRYVLTDDSTVGESKVALAERYMSDSDLAVITHSERWSAPLLRLGNAKRTLVALDSARERIAVQAALPGAIYNAWTQPNDLGISRHEAFGKEPCLACLYWPKTMRPNRHELVAQALGEAPLRVLAYLTGNFAVGLPLPLGSVPVLLAIPVPPEAGEWHERALLDDVADRLKLDVARLERWRDAPLDVLYREAVCGEAMLDFSLAATPREALVPLAHQSALAGVLLAIEVVAAADEQLQKLRSPLVEARLDVLAAWPQVMRRPRARTAGCLCSDNDFISRS